MGNAVKSIIKSSSGTSRSGRTVRSEKKIITVCHTLRTKEIFGEKLQSHNAIQLYSSSSPTEIRLTSKSVNVKERWKCNH